MYRWKKILLLLAISGSMSAQGQLAEEWTAQNKTAIKYLVEQVMALEGYADVVAKGYGIVQQGLTLVDDLKKGDFDLHHQYFSSLTVPNSRIARLARTRELFTLYQRMAKERLQLLQSSSLASLLPGERAYVQLVVERLQRDALIVKGEAERACSKDFYHMKDNERIARIDALYRALLEQHSALQSLWANVKKLTLLRALQSRDIEFVKNWSSR